MHALRAAIESTKEPAAPSIAVLPFANMSSDPEQEYFSDGLTEEIINALAQLPGLKVIARTSSFAFKGKHIDIRDIAKTLGVTTILEGSVRKGGNRIRVTAQLINVADASHLWSERYDRDLADVFAVQDDIAAAISRALQGKLAPAMAARRLHVPRMEVVRRVSQSAASAMGADNVWRRTRQLRAGDCSGSRVRSSARRAGRDLPHSRFRTRSRGTGLSAANSPGSRAWPGSRR